MSCDLVLFSDLEKISSYGSVLGTGCFLIAKEFSEASEIEGLREKIGKAGESTKFKICDLVSRADSKRVRRFRNKVDFVAVRGSTPQLNKFGVSTKAVDFLLMPCNTGRLSFDTAIARTAALNKKPIALSFSDFLNASPAERIALFRNYFMVVKLCKRFKANFLFFSGARNESELRKVRDLASFAVLLGFSEEQGKRFVGRYAQAVLE